MLRRELFYPDPEVSPLLFTFPFAFFFLSFLFSLLLFSFLDTHTHSDKRKQRVEGETYGERDSERAWSCCDQERERELLLYILCVNGFEKGKFFGGLLAVWWGKARFLQFKKRKRAAVLGEKQKSEIRRRRRWAWNNVEVLSLGWRNLDLMAWASSWAASRRRGRWCSEIGPGVQQPLKPYKNLLSLTN